MLFVQKPIHVPCIIKQSHFVPSLSHTYFVPRKITEMFILVQKENVILGINVKCNAHHTIWADLNDFDSDILYDLNRDLVSDPTQPSI